MTALAVPASSWASAWVGAQTLNVVNGRTDGNPGPQIGVDNQGNASLAIHAGKSGSNIGVQVATRPAGGAWTPLQELAVEAGGNLASFGPGFATDGAGNAVVAWPETTGTNAANCPNNPFGAPQSCLEVYAKPAGSSTWTFQAKLLQVTSSAGTFLDPAVALDPRGNGAAVVIWHSTPTAGQDLLKGVTGSVGGSWGSTPETVESVTTSTITDPQVAIDITGTPVAVWGSSTGAAPYKVRYSQRAAGTWTANDLASNNADAYTTVFERTDGQGSITAAFAASGSPLTDPSLLQTSTRDAATQTWASPTTLDSQSSGSHSNPQVFVAPDGEAVATWQWNDGNTSDTLLTDVRTAGVWGGVKTLESGTVVGLLPSAAMDGAGNTTVLWQNSGTNTLRFASRPHGGSFSAPADVQLLSSFNVVAASDPMGDASVAFPASTSSIGTNILDAAAPSLTLTTQPGAPVYPGDSIPMSATAADLWSNPVSVHWDFGDGQSGDGAAVAHAYATEGTYNAKAVATDASGNATTQTFAETVSPTPVVAPPNNPPPPPNTLPPPELGKTINVFVIKDPVFIKLPGEKKFHQLKGQAHLPNGTVIDARKGIVLVVIDNGNGGEDSAKFYEGIFEVNQPKRLKGLANIFLNGGGFKGCPKAPKDPHAQLSRSRKADTHRSVRHLWGQGTGKFRTVGRFGSATVRGTNWLTDDRCDGTLFRVKQGKVSIRDFAKQKTLSLSAPKSYFAGAKKP